VYNPGDDHDDLLASSILPSVARLAGYVPAEPFALIR
jgi:hypothetical protein